MLVEMKVTGLTIDTITNSPIVILKDADEKNTLPIWIGILEASAIATELEKLTFSRPMTHDLLRDILKRMNVAILRVEVNDLKDNVYYATIHIEDGVSTHKIDARPSDAIALALRMNSPIYVDMSVLDKSRKIDMSKEPDKKGDSKNLSELLQELSPEAFGKYKM